MFKTWFRVLQSKIVRVYAVLASGLRLLVGKVKKLSLIRQLLIVGLAIAIIFTVRYFGFNPAKETKSSKTVTATQSLNEQNIQNPVEAPKSAEAYQIVAERRTSKELSVHVFTPSYNNEQLIQLNDALLEHYKDAYSLDPEEVYNSQHPKANIPPPTEGTDANSQQPVEPSTSKVGRLKITYYSDKEIAQVKGNAADSSKLPDDIKTKIANSTLAFLIADKQMGINLMTRSASNNGQPLLKRYD
ncbi:hypothetical protein KDA11_06635 [Candidatus Saccharibacteria bacterium]|nr:hypothetical protein [Candidatus Saccharibacteria bacterium]